MTFFFSENGVYINMGYISFLDSAPSNQLRIIYGFTTSFQNSFLLTNVICQMKNHTKNILLLDISYKNLIGAKPWHIRFDKVVIGIYNATRYLILFCPEKYDVNYNRIKYLISQKSGITQIFSYHQARTKIDSYDSYDFFLEKSLLHYVIILIKLVFSKNQNHYCYNIFLEKCSYQLPKNNDKKYVFT